MRKKIIGFFLEVSSAPLSIHKICNRSIEAYSGVPGNYWPVSTAAYCIADLIKKTKELSDHISVHTFNYGTVDFKLMEADGDIENVHHCPLLNPDYPDYFETSLLKRKLLIITTNISGISTVIDESSYKQLQMLLNLPTCLGLVGGIVNMAHYVVGCHENSLLFLNPHFTHEFKPAEVDFSHYETDPTQIEHSDYVDFDPYITIVFFIKTQEDLIQFKTTFFEVCRMERSAFSTEDIKAANQAHNLDALSLDSQKYSHLFESEERDSMMRQSSSFCLPETPPDFYPNNDEEEFVKM